MPRTENRTDRDPCDRTRPQSPDAEPAPNWRSVADALEDQLAVLDRQGVILEVNRAWEESAAQLGPPWAAMQPGVNYLDLIAASDAAKDATDALGDGLRQIIAGRRRQLAVEYVAMTTSGAARFRLEVLGLQSGGHAAALLRRREIDPPAPEAQADSARAKVDLALAGTRTATWHWDVRTDTVHWDAYMHRLFGLDPNAIPIRSQEFADLIHEEDRTAVARQISLQMRGNAAGPDMRFRTVWPDGSLHVLASRGEVRRDENGQPALFVGLAWDVTDQWLSEQAQRAQARRYEVLATAGHELIQVVNTPAILDRACELTVELLPADFAIVLRLESDGTYRPASVVGGQAEQREEIRSLQFPAGMVRRLGRDAEVDCIQVVTRDAAGPVAAIQKRWGMGAGLYALLRRGDEVVGNLVALRCGDGAAFGAEEVRLMNGIAQIVCFALANARLFEELDRASRIKSEFVAAMSHELRTPLNIIIGYEQLLLEGEFGELCPPQAEALRRIGASSNNLLQMIEATLDLSRLEAGRVVATFADVAPAELLRALEDETQGLRRSPEVELRWEIPEGMRRLHTDALKLKVVLKNLVDNACKFTSAGEVTVSAKATETGVEFAVADTGPGIAADMLEAIFEPFQQGREGHEAMAGVGLGLHIVRRLLALLGGDVRATSEVGCGSTFVAFVPYEPAAAPPAESGFEAGGIPLPRR